MTSAMTIYKPRVWDGCLPTEVVGHPTILAVPGQKELETIAFPKHILDKETSLGGRECMHLIRA